VTALRSGSFFRQARRVLPRRPTDAQDHDHSTSSDQQTDHEHPEAGPDRPVELDPSVSLHVDAPDCVGVHHDRRPATELGIPRDRLLAGALGLGDPEVLLGGWSPWRSAPVQVEHGVVAVDVDQLLVGDVTEVTIDFVVGSDADEHRFLRVDLDPDVGEDLVRGPVELVCAEIDLPGGDRIGGAIELLSIRVEVAVAVTAEGVGGDDGDPTEQQRQANQPADGAKTIPTTRPAVQSDRRRTGLSVEFEGEPWCRRQSWRVPRPAHRAKK